jgi:hypothetical protein
MQLLDKSINIESGTTWVHWNTFAPIATAETISAKRPTIDPDARTYHGASQKMRTRIMEVTRFAAHASQNARADLNTPPGRALDSRPTGPAPLVRPTKNDDARMPHARRPCSRPSHRFGR